MRDRYGNVRLMSFLVCALLAVSTPPAEILRTLEAARIPAPSVSYVVLDVDTGAALISHNADVPRSPASTLKTVTTYASLDLLGPAYTWHTRALVHGRLENGVLDGNLVLQGGGDPYMTLERWWGFVRRLRAQGLKAIRGDVVIDNTAFALEPEDPGAFDGRPNRVYNVEPDALMINFQSIEFHVVPNADARTVDIVAEPAPSNLVIDNRIRYTAGRCRGPSNRVDFEIPAPRGNRVAFRGTLAGACAPRDLTRVLSTPTDYAYGTFVSLWRESGGEVDGKLRVEAAPADARVLLSYESLTLGEIVRLTNKYSSNLMARHLLLTLGEERYGPPATVAKGIAAIGDWGRARGIGLEDLAIDNGSGLSRSAHVSVRTMANVLRAAYRSPYAPEFLASLPLAGIDGTLRARMKTTPAGAVRLKTGHIDEVSGVAGYVTTPAGKTYVLVSLINDPRVDTGAGEPVHAALVKWILDGS